MLPRTPLFVDFQFAEPGTKLAVTASDPGLFVGFFGLSTPHGPRPPQKLVQRVGLTVPPDQWQSNSEREWYWKQRTCLDAFNARGDEKRLQTRSLRDPVPLHQLPQGERDGGPKNLQSRFGTDQASRKPAEGSTFGRGIHPRPKLPALVGRYRLQQRRAASRYRPECGR